MFTSDFLSRLNAAGHLYPLQFPPNNQILVDPSHILSSSISLLNFATSAFTNSCGYLFSIILSDKHALIWLSLCVLINILGGAYFDRCSNVSINTINKYTSKIQEKMMHS